MKSSSSSHGQGLLQRTTPKRVKLPLPEGASLRRSAEGDSARIQLRIVVVADTHSDPHPRAAELIAREKPDHILHAGDIGELNVIDRLARLAPTWAIRGNIDEHAPDLPDALTVDIGEGLLTLLMVHIGVVGPKLRADAARLARDEGANVVVCGHSHVPFVGRDRDLTIFNPGSIGPRRFHLPIVFGVIDIDRSRVDMRHVSCETGERWRPGKV